MSVPATEPQAPPRTIPPQRYREPRPDRARTDEERERDRQIRREADRKRRVGNPEPG